MSSKPHRGRWQAQGADITQPKGGHSAKWEESLPPTKAAGLAKLQELSEKCESRQRVVRANACTKAKRYVERAPPEGYVATGASKSFYVDPADKKHKNARIDLEITAGAAFTG